MGFRGVGLRNVSIWGDLRGGHRSCQSALGGLHFIGDFTGTVVRISLGRLSNTRNVEGTFFKRGLGLRVQGLIKV